MCVCVLILDMSSFLTESTFFILMIDYHIIPQSMKWHLRGMDTLSGRQLYCFCHSSEKTSTLKGKKWLGV